MESIHAGLVALYPEYLEGWEVNVEPVTDASGRAVCRIAAAYGEPGEYELILRVDADAADAVE